MPKSWRALVVDTLTGTVQADVVMSGIPQFNRALCQAGTWQVDLVVDEATNRGVDFHTYTRPGVYSWVVLYGDVPVQGGPVWTYGFTEATRVLSVAGSGMGGVFSRRVLRNPAGNASAITTGGNDLAYTGLSLRGILMKILADNLAQPGYNLPIDLTASEAGSSVRNYYGYELAMVWDRITELSQVNGGPEFDIGPYLTANGSAVRWYVSVGTPQIGDPNTNATWDYGAALSAIDVDVNGSAQPVSRVWVKGAGSDAAMLTGYAASSATGLPGLDFVDTNHTDNGTQADLTNYASQDLSDLSAATETWKCSVRLDGLYDRYGVEVSPALGSFSMGDAPQFGVVGHPWIPDGTYRKRILGVQQSTLDASCMDLSLGATPLRF